jgi:hypothetical protein
MKPHAGRTSSQSFNLGATVLEHRYLHIFQKKVEMPGCNRNTGHGRAAAEAVLAVGA